MAYTTNVLDAIGLACPMPIVRTRKAMQELASGDILEVLATDKGSTADMKAWAAGSGHAFLGTEIEGDTLHHFLKKDSAAIVEKEEIPVIALDEFTRKLEGDSSMTLIDVRESAEFEAGHMPGARNIPLGDVKERSSELNKETPVYLICRTGRRSGIAGIELTEEGFKNVYNIVPGMVEWTQKQTEKRGTES